MPTIAVPGRQRRRSAALLSGALSLVALLGACQQTSAENSWTLYRDSIAGESDRVHVASFDAAENELYNRTNCEQAQALFQSQKNVRTRFWCEKGRFKK